MVSTQAATSQRALKASFQLNIFIHHHGWRRHMCLLKSFPVWVFFATLSRDCTLQVCAVVARSRRWPTLRVFDLHSAWRCAENVFYRQQLNIYLSSHHTHESPFNTYWQPPTSSIRASVAVHARGRCCGGRIHELVNAIERTTVQWIVVRSSGASYVEHCSSAAVIKWPGR